MDAAGEVGGPIAHPREAAHTLRPQAGAEPKVDESNYRTAFGTPDVFVPLPVWLKGQIRDGHPGRHQVDGTRPVEQLMAPQRHQVCQWGEPKVAVSCLGKSVRGAAGGD